MRFSAIILCAGALLLGGCGSVEDGYQWVITSAGMDAESGLRAKARETLDALVSSYQDRSAMTFMNWVSDDYPGSSALLDSEIRRSFSNYFYIEINYTISSIVPSSNDDTLSVNIQYRRKLGNKNTGHIESDWGSTNVLLRKEGDVYKLLQQHSPELFI